ncbi:MAG: hypothetical protein IT434_17135 [Phycisphaerales bacterium]|nr:hypothetical protein [Phycisphaerales bacterium]
MTMRPNSTPARLGLSALLAALAFVPALALAQQQPQPPAQPPAQPSAQPPTQTSDNPGRTLESLPPPVRLGVRSDLLRRQRPVVPVLVLVTDEASYIEAIAAWSPRAIYPVLFDDGQLATRENIARFVRAFRPDKIVRWKAGAPDPAAPVQRTARVDAALRRSWGAPPTITQTELVNAWRQMGLAPPGVVVADENDPAWTAALALAAARAQLIAWVDVRNAINDAMRPDEARDYAAKIEGVLERSGLSWRALGDNLDAITICQNAPPKILATQGTPAPGDPRRQPAKPGDVFATTDFIGRHDPEGGAERYAWTSQIFGSEAQASYRAMAAIFTMPDRAWLFDGYEDKQPWNAWDATRAGDILKTAKFTVTLDDTPRQSRDDWRARAAKPLDAAIVFINSSGNCDFFNLQPGVGKPGDIPMLLRPAAVHIVHSWSAQYPAGRETVCGRWHAAGAFAYFGSVQEPYLGAFLPTPAIAERLLAGAPWAAAARIDNYPTWRLNSFGDPLFTLGEPAPRLTADKLPLTNTTDVADDTRAALASKNIALGLRGLTLQARDDDASRLALAALGKPETVDASVAMEAILPLFRAGNSDAVRRAFEKLDANTAKDPLLRDALWLVSIPDLRNAPARELLLVLMDNLRVGQEAQDAKDLFDPWVRVFGKGDALARLENAAGSVKDQRQAGEIREFAASKR